MLLVMVLVVRPAACSALRRLSNSQGNLLDDTQLIDVLAVTKQTAQVTPGVVGLPGGKLCRAG